MRLDLVILIFLSAFVIDRCSGDRIVVLYPMGSKSHFYAVLPVLEALAKRGHQLTVFSAFEGITKNTENITEVILPSVAQKLNEAEIDWFAMQKQGPAQFLTMMSNMVELVVLSCDELTTNPTFRKIIDERDVDVFIVDALGNEFTYPIIEKIGVPFVIHSSSAAIPSVLNAMGGPVEYASVPTMLTDYDDKMTFCQRIMNILSGEILKPVRNYLILNKLDTILQREFPGVRSIVELEGEASLFLLNTHHVTNWPRSLPPTIVPIGAVHARPAKPLPPKLQTFADEANHGFIIFTLGSFVNVSSMTEEMFGSFVGAFSKFPQRVFWKWEGDIPKNVPSNVMMVNWLPQQDLLGHPNARLFITHGGMLGTQETIYHGVPMLGLPFGNDQRANVAKAVSGGWGLKLDWDKISEQTLMEAFTHLIYNESVRENVKRLSLMMRDEILPGTEVAVYWVEYVLRHGGTKHLQLSSKNMPFYQKHLLDVALFFIMLFAVSLASCYYVMRFLISKIFKRTPTDPSKSKLQSTTNQYSKKKKN